MADVVLGAPHTVGWLLRESDGSPATSGVTGDVGLYTPSGAPPDIVQALAHFGGGVWGGTFTAAEMPVAGLYKALAPLISYEAGTIVLEDQAVYFTVGRASPAHRTLRDCIVDLAIELGWGLEGTTTSNGSMTTLVDSGRANSNLTSDEWIDSEILILEPGAVTDRNPLNVTAFTPASGTFGFAPAVANNVASGTDYLLLNLRGNGNNFARLKRTIVAAWREISPTQHVVDEANFTTDSTYRLAVPSQWRGIDAVQYRWGVSGPWSDIAEAYAPYDPMLGYINFTQHIGANRQLRLVGTIDCAAPDALTSIVQVPYGWLRARVLGQLFAQSDRREDQQRAAVHLEEAARTKPRG